MSKRKLAIPTIILLVVGAIIAVTTVFPFLLSNPQIELDTDTIYKIYKEESIRIPFSQWMNKASVEKNLSISPEIPFHTKWQGNTLLININPEKGTPGLISVSIAGNSSNILGRRVSDATSIDFTISSLPEVLHVHPQENAEVTENIYITFTDEMVDLGSPTTVHSISLSPTIKGTWNWVTPSTIEFFPKDQFDHSTTYKVLISKNIVNLNGIHLKNDYEYEFKTRDLEAIEEPEDQENLPPSEEPQEEIEKKESEEDNFMSPKIEKRRAILLDPEAQIEPLLAAPENIHESKFYTYIHPDREIYSPNDKLLFKGIVKSHEDATFGTPKARLVNIAVRDPDSFEIFRTHYITNKAGTFDGEIKLFDDSPEGTYTIISCLGALGHYCQGEESYSHFSVGQPSAHTEDLQPDNQTETPSRNALTLELDKDEYQIGDVARLRFKYNEEARALITVERNNIKHHEIIDVSPGYNATQIPIQDDFFPNAFVSVLVVEKDGAQKSGLHEITINKESRKINLAIKTDKTRYNPKEEITLSISTKDYKDQSVDTDLLLYIQEYSDEEENTEEEIFDFFHHLRSLDIASTSSGNVISNSKLENSATTVIWEPNIRTNVDGQAEVTLTAPDKNSLWKIKVLAITNDAKVGFVTKRLDTRKSLILNSDFPNFLHLGDQLQIKASIENNSEEKNSFFVNIETTNLNIHGENEVKIKLDAHEKKEIIFDLEAQATYSSQYEKIKIRAFNEDDQEEIEKNIQIVQPTNPKQKSISGKTKISSSQKTIHINTEENNVEKISINSGATYLANIVDDIEHLLANPVSSSVNTISRIAPIAKLVRTLRLKSFEELSLPPLRDKKGNEILFKEIVESSLQKIYELQNSDGGWNFWKFETENNKSHPTLSAFIISQIHKIQNAGFYINQNIANRAYRFVANSLYNSQAAGNEDQAVWETRAYLTAMLSEANRHELQSIQKIYEQKDILSRGAKLYLALALENTNQRTKATEIVTELLFELHRSAGKTRLLPSKKESAEIFMSDIKRTSLLFKLARQLNIENPEEENMIEWILNQSTNNLSVLDRVEIISLVTEILDSKQKPKIQFSAKIDLGNLRTQNITKDAKSMFIQERVSVPFSKFNSTKDFTIKIIKKGTGRLFFEIIESITTELNKLVATSNRIGIVRSYANLETKTPLGNLAAVKQGDIVIGKLLLIIPEERNFVMVEEFLPAGLTFTKELSSNTEPSPFDIHEFQKNRILLFAEKLSPGIYLYSFEAQATHVGKFFHQQTKAFEVYTPEISSTTKPGWLNVASQ